VRCNRRAFIRPKTESLSSGRIFYSTLTRQKLRRGRKRQKVYERGSGNKIEKNAIPVNKNRRLGKLVNPGPGLSNCTTFHGISRKRTYSRYGNDGTPPLSYCWAKRGNCPLSDVVYGMRTPLFRHNSRNLTRVMAERGKEGQG